MNFATHKTHFRSLGVIVGAAIFFTGCGGSESIRSTSDLDSLNSQSELMGTQIGNPDGYEVSLLVNNQPPFVGQISIASDDLFSCASHIDSSVLSYFEQQLNEENLTLMYFVKVTDDRGLVRNFMNQVLGATFVQYFGPGSNLILKCQAIIYSRTYQRVYDEFSRPVYCNECGGGR